MRTPVSAPKAELKPLLFRVPPDLRSKTKRSKLLTPGAELQPRLDYSDIQSRRLVASALMDIDKALVLLGEQKTQQYCAHVCPPCMSSSHGKILEQIFFLPGR